LENARRKHLVRGNVARDVDLPALRERKATTAWSAAQVVGYLAAADADAQPWVGPCLRLMVDLGCRRSELIGLSWADVDLAAGEVHIRRGLVLDATTGALLESRVKTEGSVRSLPIGAPTVPALRSLRAAQVAAALSLGVSWSPDLPVVAGADLRRVRPERLSRVVAATAKAAGRITRVRISCGGAWSPS